MILNLRTKISLSQLLDKFDYPQINILFEKHSLSCNCFNITDIKDVLTTENIISLIQEIVLTKRELRSRINPKYVFDERWDDFEKCLLLDGYKINENNTISSIEPSVDGIIAMEDDLIAEINQSSLSKKDEIIQLIKESEEAFKNATPDYNGCLSKSRIAIETIVRSKVEDETSTSESWGRSLNILKANGFITDNEEQALVSIYRLVSDGSHKPLGFTDEEYSRYGRNLIMTTCYYIIKKQNASNTTDEPF